jgi:hypothetical protein
VHFLDVLEADVVVAMVVEVVADVVPSVTLELRPVDAEFEDAVALVSGAPPAPPLLAAKG